MPSRFTQYGGAAGADAALQQMVAERIAAQMEQQKRAVEAYKIQQDDRRITQGDRRIDVDQEQFGQTIGLNRDKFGQDKAEFEAGAPQREAQTGYLRTQTRDLEQKPLYAEQGRQHDESMANLQGRIRTGQIAQQGQIDAGLIDRRASAAAQGKQTSPYSAERSTRVKESVRELRKKISPWTTGMGSILANIPATDARNFNAEIDTLKANIAFGELTEMREASKTGGALGQVSERELALLQSALGALDTGQSGANLDAQMQKIEESLNRWELAKSGMANPLGRPVDAQAPAGMGAPNLDALRQQYGY